MHINKRSVKVNHEIVSRYPVLCFKSLQREDEQGQEMPKAGTEKCIS